MLKVIKDFIKLESSSACILLAATIFALICSNSSLQNYYDVLLRQTFIIHFINEGLMTLFFLIVGLEVKHELLYGALNSVKKAILPGIAAIGGMLAPALIYVALNYNDSIALRGWAIPTATDIAFSLGILVLVGSRVPRALTIFLMALAIFDDLAAILIIAVFYTSSLSFIFLALALFCIGILAFLNKKNITQLRYYGCVSFVLWFCLMQSGIHPTLAGVILAFSMPLPLALGDNISSADKLQQRLHPWVSFVILPLFAFVNAGISFSTISMDTLKLKVAAGIFLGLFLGKPIGILGSSWLSVKLRLAALPENIRWKDMFAVSMLCGIGFTISLFIATLAFGNYSAHLAAVKIGVIVGSVLSGGMGYALMRKR